jgi:RimJ/RimL family protein N-acetyltransferase
MKRIKLDDNTLVELKVADRHDYENGRYEYLYGWLSRVDQFLARSYKSEDLEETKQYWLRSFDRNRLTLIGLYEGKIIGSATLILNDPKSRAAHVASFGIAVHPDFQRKGLGKQLILALEEKAKELGIAKIEVNCYERNAAIALYQSLNYSYEGRRLKKGRLDDGTFADEILFYKFLRPS